MTEPQARGLFESLRALFASGVALLSTRFELLVTEFEEEKCRLVGLAAYGAAAFLLLAAATVFLAIFLTVLFWDSDRLLVLGVFTAVFFVLGLVALVLAVRHSRGRPFAASLAELEKDREALGGRSPDTRP